MSLTSEQRQEEILTRVLGVGHVVVKALAVDMGVSEATVRRDLRALADARKVELVYGGATMPRTADFTVLGRARRNVEAKRIVGRLAAGLVPDGEMMYVDSGTTCFEMRRHLMQKRGLSILLNSTRLAMELNAGSDASIVLLGGHYRPERMDTVGPLAVAAIDQLRGYVAFIGADGLDPDFGVTADDIQTAFLYQHVLRNARETILLADHTKFLCPSLYRICTWDAISRVVTDVRPDDEWVEFLNKNGIELIHEMNTEAPGC
ncbi:MAG TPA: DeoR/GlpR family DNA-binding transcription regulator [Armatimonadota bacterium]|jgi:DeoR family transcriptional regulator of aga operon